MTPVTVFCYKFRVINCDGVFKKVMCFTEGKGRNSGLHQPWSRRSGGEWKGLVPAGNRALIQPLWLSSADICVTIRALRITLILCVPIIRDGGEEFFTLALPVSHETATGDRLRLGAILFTAYLKNKIWINCRGYVTSGTLYDDRDGFGRRSRGLLRKL
jgi:hypothetical protein